MLRRVFAAWLFAGLLTATAFGQVETSRGSVRAEPTTAIRVFKLVHRSPSEAFALVQPLLSKNGAVTVTPQLKLISVRDVQQRLEIVAEAMRQFDVAPGLFRIQITFYRATEEAADVEAEPKDAPTRLRGLGRRMADMLRYTDYDKIGEVVVTSEEGSTVETRMGEAYHLEFTLEGDPVMRRRIRLRGFQVNRIRKDDRGVEQLAHVFRTSVNLRMGKPFVLGATRDEKSRSALLIALLAEPVRDEVAP